MIGLCCDALSAGRASQPPARQGRVPARQRLAPVGMAATPPSCWRARCRRATRSPQVACGATGISVLPIDSKITRNTAPDFGHSNSAKPRLGLAPSSTAFAGGITLRTWVRWYCPALHWSVSRRSPAQRSTILYVCMRKFIAWSNDDSEPVWRGPCAFAHKKRDARLTCAYCKQSEHAGFGRGRLPSARMPCRCTSFWSRSWPTRTPRANNAYQVPGRPQLPSGSAWISLRRSSRASSLRGRRWAALSRSTPSLFPECCAPS